MKKILVIGGTSGLGAEICRNFKEQNHDVTATWCSDQSMAMNFFEDTAIKTKNCDVSSVSSLDSLFGELTGEDQLPQQIVFCAVADIKPVPMHLIDADLLQEHFQVSVQGFVNLLQASLKYLRAGGGVDIVSIGTVFQQQPEKGLSYYAALKSAQEKLLEGFLLEYKNLGFSGKTFHPSNMGIGQGQPLMSSSLNSDLNKMKSELKSLLKNINQYQNQCLLK